MKIVRKVLIVFCAVMILVGIVAGVLVIPDEMPPQRSLLHEVAPSPNALRVAREINGVGDSRFFIQSPKLEALQSVSVADFGASSENADNADALNEAFAYCIAHPGTRLVFEKKVYYVSGELHIEGLTDACIDGNGATILYDNRDGLFNMYSLECVEIRDLTFDWDWDKKPLGAIARVVAVKGEKNTVDLVFDVPAFAREDMLYAITECDEESGTYGAKGTLIEFYDENRDQYKSITKISDDTIRVVHSGALTRFDGKKCILRSDAYGGSLIRIDRESKHVTLNGVRLYGGSGMGVIIGGRSSHFALNNVFIGPNPEHPERCTSLDADAVHINDAGGCFVIENCDFSRQGDDDVNVNCGIAIIRRVEGRTVYFDADGSMDTEPGDRMIFRDDHFHLTEYTAVVESCERIGAKERKVTFKSDLPAAIKKDYMFFNADVSGGNYVIRNNYFHEHRARGLLLQTSDGLVENNVFYKISHDAIRIVMDISTGYWNEGTGADNILIRNNTFVECGVIGTEVIEVGTHIDGKSGRAYAFTNITIENNDFKEICGNLLLVNNVNNFVFKNNTVTIGDVYSPDVRQGRSYFIRDCANIDYSHNTFTDVAPFSFTRIIRSDNPLVWGRLNLRSLFRKRGAK